MNIVIILCLIIIILLLFFIYNEAVSVKTLLRHLVSVADPDFSETKEAEEIDLSVKPENLDK